jgi:hypothetical protein
MKRLWRYCFCCCFYRLKCEAKKKKRRQSYAFLPLLLLLLLFLLYPDLFRTVVAFISKDYHTRANMLRGRPNERIRRRRWNSSLLPISRFSYYYLLFFEEIQFIFIFFFFGCKPRTACLFAIQVSFSFFLCFISYK